MYSRFRTEIKVRPDDIDMNNHVHFSKYLDYVLAARYDQMINNYKMSMQEFIDLGYIWFVSESNVKYLRQLNLEDTAVVETGLTGYSGAQCTVTFQIFRKSNMKLAAEGSFIYTMVSIKTGRPVAIPEEIIEKYSV